MIYDIPTHVIWVNIMNLPVNDFTLAQRSGIMIFLTTNEQSSTCIVVEPILAIGDV